MYGKEKAKFNSNLLPVSEYISPFFIHKLCLVYASILKNFSLYTHVKVMFLKEECS